MRIAICHDQVIPPKQYGGTERVLSWLGSGLVKKGHEVVLVAPRGSFIPGAEWVEYQPARSFEAQVPAHVDLLHLSAPPAVDPKRPYIVTVHGNGKPGEVFPMNSVFVSRKHAELHQSSTFVYNGIDLDSYVCDITRENSLVFLAKASWAVKNLEGAIQVARRLGMKLEVLGSRDYPMGLHRWMPTLRGVKYHGMVNDHEKREILRKARALVFPVRWHEPFGLAVTESLASGCAVLATPYGSLPEIVTSDVGVLAAQASALVSEFRQREDGFCPQASRARVSSGGFDSAAMVDRYLSVYRSVLETGSVNPSGTRSPPQLQVGTQGTSSKTLLPWGPF